MNSFKLAVEAGSADQEAAEEFFKSLLSIVHEKRHIEEKVFNADETGWFYKNVGK